MMLQWHNRIHDLVIDLAVQCPGPWGTAQPCVCAEFIGLAIGTGRPGMGIPWEVRTTTAALNQGYYKAHNYVYYCAYSTCTFVIK